MQHRHERCASAGSDPDDLTVEARCLAFFPQLTSNRPHLPCPFQSVGKTLAPKFCYNIPDQVKPCGLVPIKKPPKNSQSSASETLANAIKRALTTKRSKSCRGEIACSIYCIERTATSCSMFTTSSDDCRVGAKHHLGSTRNKPGSPEPWSQISYDFTT